MGIYQREITQPAINWANDCKFLIPCVCTYTTITMKTNLRAWDERDYGNRLQFIRLWKRIQFKQRVMGQVEMGKEKNFREMKCCAGGHPEANLTWVIYDLFQLWTCALWPTGPDVLPWSLCCIAHKIETGLEFNSRPFTVLSSIFNGAVLWKDRVLIREALVWAKTTCRTFSFLRSDCCLPSSAAPLPPSLILFSSDNCFSF